MGKHLAKSVRVVGVIAHNVAVAVGIKIFDGKALHMAEHFKTDILKDILGNFRHGAVIEKRRENSYKIDGRHYRKGADKRKKIRVLNAYERSDVIIDKGFNEKRGSNACNSSEDDAEKDKNHRNAVVFKIGKKSFNCCHIKRRLSHGRFFIIHRKG